MSGEKKVNKKKEDYSNKSPHKIKAIIFDFWGTLADENSKPSAMRATKKILKVRKQFSEFVPEFEKVYMLKSFTSQIEAFDEVCKYFGVEVDEKKKEKFIGLWNRVKLASRLYKDVKDNLSKLKGKYKLGLIINTNNLIIEDVLKRFEIEDFFDYIALSYKEKALKSDKLIDIILEKLGVKPEEALLIGDSIYSDIEYGKQKGVNVLLIDRREKRKYFSPRIKSLNHLERYLRMKGWWIE